MKRINKRTVLLLAGLAAMLTAPLALAAGEGNPTRGGARNPSSDKSQSYTRETEIIANTSTYGTRQSNKSDNGGGAVYGCRSKAGGSAAGNEPCLRATNLADGSAFEFNTNTGVLGGLITVGRGGDNAKPFTTNATGVATGLNADRVDGKSADDFLAKDAKVDADKLDGRESASFASAGDLAFAIVNAAGNVTAGRGARSASVDEGTNTFTVVFDRDVSKCSYTVTQSGGEATGVDFAATATGGNANAVTVDESGDADPAVPFNLQVVC